MIKSRIIVTGATGKTGSVVVAELLKVSYPVRTMVRREDGRSALLKEKHETAESSARSIALFNCWVAWVIPPLQRWRFLLRYLSA